MFPLEINDAATLEMLGVLQWRMRNLRPVMSVIGEIVKTSIKRNFEVGGRYSEPGSWKGGSQTWQPLSLVTLLAGGRYLKKSGKWRKGAAERLEKRKILIKTGRLMKSITYKAADNQVATGSSLVYAAAQNFGLGERTSLKSRRRMPALPARPFEVVQDEDLAEMREAMLEFIVGA